MKIIRIFLNGFYDQNDLVFYKKEISQGGQVIAADGAGKFVESLGSEPDILVGDFDSELRLDERAAKLILKYRRDKDFTDGELALQEALKLKPREIYVYGFLPRNWEMDHFYGNLRLLYAAAVEGVKAAAKSPVVDIYLLATLDYSTVSFEAKRGDKISLAPYACFWVHDVETTGLRWPLQHQDILSAGGKYLRNEPVQDGPVTVTIHGNALLIFHQKKYKREELPLNIQEGEKIIQKLEERVKDLEQGKIVPYKKHGRKKHR